MNDGPYGGMNRIAYDARSRLRPMGIGDILDETFRLYRDNFTLFVATCAVLELPAQIISTLLSLSAPAVPRLNTTGTITSAQLQTYLSNLGASASASFAGALVVGLATIFLTAALAVVISRRYLSEPVTVGQAYRATLSRIGALLLATIWIAVRIIGIFIAIGIVATIFVVIKLWPIAVLLGLIGTGYVIYLAISWALISPVIVLENRSGIAASGRSRFLVRGYWWKTLFLLIIVALLVYILIAIPLIIEGSVLSLGSGTAPVLVARTIGLLVSVLVSPIQVAANTLLFYDLKIRKEAFDLEAMVRQASLEPTSTQY